MNLSKLLKGLTNSQPQTAAELRSTLSKIDQQALLAEVDRLEERRRQMLLHGTDTQVAAVSSELAAANLACERGAAAADELNRLILEAEEREAAASLAATESAAAKLRAEIEAAETEITMAATTIDGALKTVRVKIEALRKHSLAIAKATGQPIGRLPEAAAIRSHAVNRISH